MARTIIEIKKSMTDHFMSDSVIRDKYSLVSGDTFDAKFSKVSVENILFFIVATAIYAIESLFDDLKIDVDARIAQAVIASIPWYHKKCLEFQYGDSLIFDEKTMQYKYASYDETKKVVKYASVRDNNNGVDILVSGDKTGKPIALSNDVLTAFKCYLNAVKPAGVLVNINSFDPDNIIIKAKIKYNPMVLLPSGALISDPGIYPVQDAIMSYVSGIAYGGVFNKTRLVDAIQQADGVDDIILESVIVKPATAATYTEVISNSSSALSGSFIPLNTDKTISYVQEL